MSVYNAERYLAEALSSILQQTYTNFEFIIVNDGSMDNSLSIIRSFQDNRIELIDNQGNKGLIYSLNTAFKKANGKYIVRMDADDISFPDRIETQIRFMEENPQIGVCSCNYLQFSESESKMYRALTNHDEIFSFMLFNCSVVHPTLVIRKDIINKQQVVFDEKFKHAEDYELWSRLLFDCRFSSVDQVLLKYRLHAHQVSTVYKTDQHANANKIRENMLMKAGFSFTADELQVFCRLGNSLLITNYKDLTLLETFLNKLIDQNNRLKIVSPSVFERVIKKHWLDACGLTTLGLKAYFHYLRSNLRNKNNESLAKLFIKCLVRQLKRQ